MLYHDQGSLREPNRNGLTRYRRNRSPPLTACPARSTSSFNLNLMSSSSRKPQLMARRCFWLARHGTVWSGELEAVRGGQGSSRAEAGSGSKVSVGTS